MNNNKALFIASFLTLIAAGMGFSIRGAILGDWETQFGFTKSELGGITGGGLVGFGIMIILFSTVTDKIGYKPLMIVAFLLHVLSAVVTLAATPKPMPMLVTPRTTPTIVAAARTTTEGMAT